MTLLSRVSSRQYVKLTNVYKDERIKRTKLITEEMLIKAKMIKFIYKHKACEIIVKCSGDIYNYLVYKTSAERDREFLRICNELNYNTTKKYSSNGESDSETEFDSKSKVEFAVE